VLHAAEAAARAFAALRENPQDFFAKVNAPNIIPTVHNVVATINLQTLLNLQKIATYVRLCPCPISVCFRLSPTHLTCSRACRLFYSRFILSLQGRNTEYNPRKFASAVMRMREPRVTAVIFQSGKLVIFGKSEHETRLGARKVARIIQKIDAMPDDPVAQATSLAAADAALLEETQAAAAAAAAAATTDKDAAAGQPTGDAAATAAAAAASSAAAAATGAGTGPAGSAANSANAAGPAGTLTARSSGLSTAVTVVPVGAPALPLSSADLARHSMVRFTEFKIQNIVAGADCRFPIHLDALASANENFCSYEPELFPGLVYRMAEPAVALMVFVTGRVVIIGAKSRGQAYLAFSNLYPVLLAHRKDKAEAEQFEAEERERLRSADAAHAQVLQYHGSVQQYMSDFARAPAGAAAAASSSTSASAGSSSSSAAAAAAAAAATAIAATAAGRSRR
jgi:TATA-box binding protein (TBP) (component of TFIID and TFIIIB)